VGLHLVAAHTSGALLVGADLDAHRLRPGHDYGAGLRGNSLGYPGPEFERPKAPGVFRVAALGDSFAVGPAVPFSDNYLTLLGRRLPGVQVYNFGVSGAGPREYLAVLRRDGWAHQPDAVLLSVFVGNDVTEEMPAPRHLHPRQHALVLLCERGSRLWQECRHQDTPPGPPDRLRPALTPATFRAVEARRLAVCLQPAPPGLEKKWQRALAHLAAIVRECRQRQVPLAVVLIPDEFQVNPAVLAQAVSDTGIAPAAVDVPLPQRRLRAAFAQHGVPCLDLLEHFAGVPDTYAPNDTHWNVAGNQLAAARLAVWLRQTWALPEDAP
jgi:lysophospholipase L1-like esterase